MTSPNSSFGTPPVAPVSPPPLQRRITAVPPHKRARIEACLREVALINRDFVREASATFDYSPLSDQRFVCDSYRRKIAGVLESYRDAVGGKVETLEAIWRRAQEEKRAVTKKNAATPPHPLTGPEKRRRDDDDEPIEGSPVTKKNIHFDGKDDTPKFMARPVKTRVPTPHPKKATVSVSPFKPNSSPNTSSSTPVTAKSTPDSEFKQPGLPASVMSKSFASDSSNPFSGSTIGSVSSVSSITVTPTPATPTTTSTSASKSIFASATTSFSSTPSSFTSSFTAPKSTASIPSFSFDKKSTTTASTTSSTFAPSTTASPFSSAAKPSTGLNPPTGFMFGSRSTDKPTFGAYPAPPAIPKDTSSTTDGKDSTESTSKDDAMSDKEPEKPALFQFGKRVDEPSPSRPFFGKPSATSGFGFGSGTSSFGQSSFSTSSKPFKNSIGFSPFSPARTSPFAPKVKQESGDEDDQRRKRPKSGE